MSLDLSLYKKKSQKRGGSFNKEIWTKNITHNLGRMAKEVSPEEGTTLYDLMWCSPGVITDEYIDQIKKSLAIVVMDRNRLIRYNPDNGWGDYEGLLEYLEDFYSVLHPGYYLEVSK